MPSHPKITIPYIQKKFDDFNRQYFGNLLPPIPVKLSNAKTFLGKVCFRKERKLFSRKWHYSDFILRINTRIELPEEMVEEIILHEMIHLYVNAVGNNGSRRYRQGHGKLWTQTAKYAQSLYGQDLGNIEQFATKDEIQKYNHYYGIRTTKSLVNAYLVKLTSGDLVPIKDLTPEQIVELQGMNIIGIFQVKPGIQQEPSKRVTKFIDWDTLVDCIENGIDYETESVCNHLRIQIGKDTETIWLNVRK